MELVASLDLFIPKCAGNSWRARSWWLVLTAILLPLPCGGSELDIPVPVCIMPTTSDKGEFSDFLAIEFSQYDKAISVVPPEHAQVMVVISSFSRGRALPSLTRG